MGRSSVVPWALCLVSRHRVKGGEKRNRKKEKEKENRPKEIRYTVWYGYGAVRYDAVRHIQGAERRSNVLERPHAETLISLDAHKLKSSHS